MVIISAHADGTLACNGKTYRCSLGRAGVTEDKKEGDSATPVGIFPLRYVYYRADRIPAIETALAIKPLNPDDGWCDAPRDPKYNQPVKMPYDASAENLWRDDHVYDIIVILGYNDDPPVPGGGSAIFMHIARETYSPTAGCIALAKEDLLEILRTATPGDEIRIGN